MCLPPTNQAIRHSRLARDGCCKGAKPIAYAHDLARRAPFFAVSRQKVLGPARGQAAAGPCRDRPPRRSSVHRQFPQSTQEFMNVPLRRGSAGRRRCTSHGSTGKQTRPDRPTAAHFHLHGSRRRNASTRALREPRATSRVFTPVAAGFPPGGCRGAPLPPVAAPQLPQGRFAPPAKRPTFLAHCCNRSIGRRRRRRNRLK